jgi:hypothetical protein
MKDSVPSHIYKMMSKEECDKLLILSINGLHVYKDGNTTVLMGSNQMKMYTDYVDDITTKYENIRKAKVRAGRFVYLDVMDFIKK